jgi:alpha-L-arabinofuranosidase
VVDASAIMDGNRISVFMVNRSPSSKTDVELALAGATDMRLVDAEIVTGKDPKAANEFGKPPVVSSVPYLDGVCVNGKAIVSMPPLSFVAATFEL